MERTQARDIKNEFVHDALECLCEMIADDKIYTLTDIATSTEFVKEHSLIDSYKAYWLAKYVKIYGYDTVNWLIQRIGGLMEAKDGD